MDENLRKARMAQCFSWLDQLIYKYHSFIQCFSQSFVSLDKSNIFLHYLENFALCMIYNCSHWKASKLAARGRGFRPPPKWMLNYIIFLWRASFNFLKPNECYTSWLKNKNNRVTLRLLADIEHALNTGKQKYTMWWVRKTCFERDREGYLYSILLYLGPRNCGLNFTWWCTMWSTVAGNANREKRESFCPSSVADRQSFLTRDRYL